MSEHRWVASATPSDGTPPWGIGIEGKGPREWFDTQEDAERAVALLNRAWDATQLARRTAETWRDCYVDMLPDSVLTALPWEAK